MKKQSSGVSSLAARDLESRNASTKDSGAPTASARCAAVFLREFWTSGQAPAERRRDAISKLPVKMENLTSRNTSMELG